jgi:NADP-dependent 3-hydroxy acid dehydrogenase YdfG
MQTNPQTILISGASSGLGAAIARAYAAPGVTLFLGGRDQDRLNGVADACREAGAVVYPESIDVTEIEAMRHWVVGSDATKALDLVIANAGISGGTSGLQGAEPEDQVRRLFDVNVGGVMNTVLPIIPILSARGVGQIAMVASLAGYRGIPGAPAYCASKAAVKVFGEGLTGTLHGLGVGVSVICPGYVRTPLTDANAFPMPFLMEADAAADIIKRGISKRKARIAFPWPMATAVWLLQALSPGLIEPLLRRLPKK